MKKKQTTYISLVVFVAVLVILNLLAGKFFLRLDFTEDKRYTLSDATKNVLTDLIEPVTVTVYFSKDVPQEIVNVRNEFHELLTEYASISRGMVAYEFINPDKNEENEQKAQEAGINPIMINKTEKDQSVQKRAYLGAIIQAGENSEAIPVIQPGASMEYNLTTLIKKLAVADKPVIGFVMGHGEASPNEMIQAVQGLSVLYNVEPVQLSDTANLSKYKAVALIRPQDSIPQQHLNYLDEYLAGGGNLFVALNRVTINFANLASEQSVTTGLESWLEGKGIIVDGKFLMDARCGNITVQGQNGFMRYNQQVNFPYLPIISQFAKHPITEGLDAVIMQFASPLTFAGDSTIKFTPLALSSDKAGVAPIPVRVDPEKQWRNDEFPEKNIAVAGLFEGLLSGKQNSKMVVVTDGDFPINGQGQNMQRLQQGNINLFVNAVDWMGDDSGLIELRNKGVSLRMLDEIEDSKRVFLKWFNFILPIVLVIVLGVYRAQRSRIRSLKIKEENYA